MANIAVQRIKRELKEVLNSDEVIELINILWIILTFDNFYIIFFYRSPDVQSMLN